MRRRPDRLALRLEFGVRGPTAHKMRFDEIVPDPDRDKPACGGLYLRKDIYREMGNPKTVYVIVANQPIFDKEGDAVVRHDLRTGKS